MKTELKMIFKTRKGSLVILTMPDPKANLDEETIRAAMQVVIDKNIFETANGELAEPVSAKIVETSEVAYDLAK